MAKFSKSFTLILILLLLLGLGFTNSTLLVKGQPSGYEVKVHVSSPIQNETYQTNNIPLNFTLDIESINASLFQQVLFMCNLDGQTGYHGGSGISIGGIPDGYYVFLPPFPSTYNTTINVPNGNHLLWVEADLWLNDSSYDDDYPITNLSQIVSFTVDNTTLSSTSPSPSSTQIPTPSTSPSPSPTVPELSWLIIVPLLLSVFSVVVIVRHRKTTK